MEWIYPTCTGYIIKIQAVPGAVATQIVGPYGDRLKIRLAAAPEKGEANKTLLDFLAQRLNLPKNHLRLKSGARDRAKVIEITGLDPEIRERLRALWP
ncbi:MAG: DUF167 domain-containing protein [Deltaproteobacteria bacterium]|nr:DUF167 domain-containing protein [Deltaproteobacteria bacterium]